MEIVQNSGQSVDLGGPVPYSNKGVLITEETRVEEEVQVVGSIHSTVEAG